MKKILLYPFAAAGALLLACNKPEVIPPPTPEDGAMNTFEWNYTESLKQTFTVDVTTGALVTGEQGTKIYIYPGDLLDGNNNPATGNVTVELIEIYDRATMLLTNKATVGVLQNGDHDMLISGGEYYLSISQNFSPLTIANPLQVYLPTSNTGGTDNNMALFEGVFEGPDDDILWEFDNDSVAVVADSTFAGDYYQILDGNWGWANVDRFYSYTGAKTTLLVELPDGYNMENSEVFLTYDGEPTALARLDTYTNDGYFSEHYGLIPVGLAVHVIAVTMIDDELHYAIQGATITDGGVISISNLAPTTQAALADMINDLP